MNGKAKIIALFFVVSGFYVCQVEAVDITFTSDGVIQEPNIYGNVHILNNATVDMSGGTVTWTVETWEQSTFNFSDGLVGSIHAYESSTVNITGGTLVTDLDVRESSLVNIYDVEMINARGFYLESGTVNIYGGNMSVHWAKIYDDEDSELNILGGNITFQSTDFLVGPENNNFSIYGCNFDYDPNSYVFTGSLLYGGQITLNDIWPDEYEHLNLVVLPPPVIDIVQAIAEKTEMLEAIDEALDKEWQAYDALEELLQSRDYGDLNKADIVKARQKIHSSIQHQEQSKDALEKSIEKLQDALTALGWESLTDGLIRQ